MIRFLSLAVLAALSVNALASSCSHNSDCQVDQTCKTNFISGRGTCVGMSLRYAGQSCRSVAHGNPCVSGYVCKAKEPKRSKRDRYTYSRYRVIPDSYHGMGVCTREDQKQ